MLSGQENHTLNPGTHEAVNATGGVSGTCTNASCPICGDNSFQPRAPTNTSHSIGREHLFPAPGSLETGPKFGNPGTQGPGLLFGIFSLFVSLRHSPPEAVSAYSMVGDGKTIGNRAGRIGRRHQIRDFGWYVQGRELVQFEDNPVPRGHLTRRNCSCWNR